MNLTKEDLQLFLSFVENCRYGGTEAEVRAGLDHATQLKERIKLCIAKLETPEAQGT